MVRRISKKKTKLATASDSVSTFWVCLLLAILLIPTLSHAESYPFGRLITDDSERRALDRLRRNSNRMPETVEAAPIALNQETLIQIVPTKVKFSGYISRSDGKYSVWLDGKSDLSTMEPGLISVMLAPDQSSAILSSSNADATLRPGQIWYLEQGIVKDHYQKDASLTFKDNANAQTTPSNSAAPPKTQGGESLLKSTSKVAPKTADKLAQEMLIKKAVGAHSNNATNLNIDTAHN